jgi:sigma-E factor negative regulatory protein RseA
MSERARERLSALVDGEAVSADLQEVLAAGRESARTLSVTCETWHVYHLIGDVMRSEDLAGAGRDGAFLERLRGRLAQEPVVVAPAAVARPPSEEVQLHQVAQGAPVARYRRSGSLPLAARSERDGGDRRAGRHAHGPVASQRTGLDASNLAQSAPLPGKRQ